MPNTAAAADIEDQRARARGLSQLSLRDRRAQSPDGQVPRAQRDRGQHARGAAAGLLHTRRGGSGSRGLREAAGDRRAGYARTLRCFTRAGVG